ncbi:MAG: amidohydrolase family protein, partial [Desulfovibrionaceae bacterium]
EIIRLLMDADYRRSWLEELHPRVRNATCLFDLDREYTLEEIATVTRSGPAGALGLARKGHLGAGADADVAIYRLNDDKRAMFSSPALVIKGGTVVVREGEVVQSVDGTTMHVQPEGGESLPEDLADTFDGYYTVKLANYMVEDEYLEKPEVVPCG